MKVLVACEESQTITKAFRELGHEAYSCDIIDCSGGYPEWHIKRDAIEVAYNGNWDIMIAHPPCTYLSKAGAASLYRHKKLQINRYNEGIKAREFFMQLFNAPIPKICIENPTPLSIFRLPRANQVIQPFEYGEPFSKRTLLWLKNLQPLKPTRIIKTGIQTTTDKNTWFDKGGKNRAQLRSKTFSGIANAMATQWSQEYRENTLFTATMEVQDGFK